MKMLRMTVSLALMASFVLATAACSSFRKAPPDRSAAWAPSAAIGGNQVISPYAGEATPKNAPAEGVRAEWQLIPDDLVYVIYFDYDRSNLRADQQARLERNLAYFRANPDLRIGIEGHCDERGSTEYNLSLGMRRANATRDYYIQNGIPANRIDVRSMGEEQPADPAHNEAAWAKNRRAMFYHLVYVNN